MKILAADLFCGAGGGSTGLARACSGLGLGLDLVAVNHWSVAIDTHSRNHPEARHLCASLDAVDPMAHVPGGRLNLLVASPECTHFSTARGGRPMCNQSRASAWMVLKWAQELYIENILIENVKEFMSWGPLGADSRPLASKRGATFGAFLAALESLDYSVDYRILNAADYGDPTTRERLFVQARRKPRRVTWPEATHARDPQPELFAQRRPWRTAREIIDWSLPGQSIFARKRPLAKATLERIAAGLRKFGGKAAEPFLVTACHGGPSDGRCHSLEKPVPTVVGSNTYGLVEPIIVPLNHGAADKRAYSVDRPLPTLTSTDAWGLVQPFLIAYYGTGNVSGIDDPLPTVTTRDRFGLVQPVGLDIRFRMLTWRELARAQGFPEEYEFGGTRGEIVKQVGNAVPRHLAQALCADILAPYARRCAA